MSVAFRRDSDEEHREPRFELPLPPGPNYVTAGGPALIAGRIAALEADLADAAEPEAIRRQLRYWITRRATAEVVAPPADGSVGIGSAVRVRTDGRERTVVIVGHDEADPAAGRLGYSAPLARALMGAEAGDLVDFNGCAGAVEVLAVEASA